MLEAPWIGAFDVLVWAFSGQWCGGWGPLCGPSRVSLTPTWVSVIVEIGAGQAGRWFGGVLVGDSPLQSLASQLPQGIRRAQVLRLARDIVGAGVAGDEGISGNRNLSWVSIEVSAGNPGRSTWDEGGGFTGVIAGEPAPTGSASCF